MAPPLQKSSSVGGAARPDRRHFQPDDVRLGYVSGIFGLQGQVRLFLYHRDGDVWDEPVSVDFVSADGARHSRVVHAQRSGPKRVFAVVEGVDTPEQARALMGSELVVPPGRLPRLPDGEYYHRDLLGLPVRTSDGRDLGRLAEIYTASEVDTWVVRGPAGETYLAALRGLVLAVHPGDHILVDDSVGDTL
jgi:16S rRNA processing protein RimM